MAEKSFNIVLGELRFGETLDELTSKMAELVAAVGNTQKVGEITIKLKLKPGAGGSIEITDEIKAKIPELPKGSSLFFATPENNLVRNDPRQQALPLKSVDSGVGQLKEVTQ